MFEMAESLAVRVESELRQAGCVATVAVRAALKNPGLADMEIDARDAPPVVVSVAEAWPTTRIMCAGYVFDDVPGSAVPALVSGLLSGVARVELVGRLNRRVRLTVDVAGETYQAHRGLGHGLDVWEEERLRPR